MSKEESPKNEILLSPVAPLVTPAEAVKAWNQFLELKRQLLSDDDYQLIAGKRFVKKSGFRKLSVFFSLSDRVVDSQRIEREDHSFYWRVVTEVTAPNGRSSVGVAICDSKEKKTSSEHVVYSTAATRSKSRGISDLIAGGEVSAEEMETSSIETSTSKEPASEESGLVNGVSKSSEPPKRTSISYTIDGPDAVFKIPYTSKDRFKEIIHATTGAYPTWNGSAKTWSVNVDLVNFVLAEELEKGGFDLEVL